MAAPVRLIRNREAATDRSRRWWSKGDGKFHSLLGRQGYREIRPSEAETSPRRSDLRNRHARLSVIGDSHRHDQGAANLNVAQVDTLDGKRHLRCG